jgi:hypothetical protein
MTKTTNQLIFAAANDCNESSVSLTIIRMKKCLLVSYYLELLFDNYIVIT